MLNEFSDLFTNNVGEIKNVKAELHLENNATPIFCKARTVKYALRNAVNEEILRLVDEGILKPVTTSKWVTPIVPVVKPNGKIRLCGDFKVTVNKFLKVDKYPLPKIDDILATLGGGKHFTKIDLNQAYLHLPVEENSQELLTINTPKGLFKFTRLPYGIASSPAIWQRTIEQILNGIEGISVFIDDICISGETDEIHLQRLKLVLERLREFNLKINKEKSFFMKDEINYCGYKINKSGIHKTQEKVEAILNAPRPTNITQIKSFLGLVTYYSKFVPNLSTIAHPLHNLLRKNVKFRWSTECENAFKKIKNEITSDRVLTHFNPKLPLVLATDASPYGISAVLSHTMPDGSEKPIAFVSKTLSNAEKRYSQVDKEALAIIFGVKRFFQYLYGRRFTLFTDSKPLVSIFSPTKSIPVLSAARMQRYAIYLQTFNYDIKYKKSIDNSNADALSRLPICSEDLSPPSSDTPGTLQKSVIIDEAEFFQINQISVLPITAKTLALETQVDPILKKVYSYLISGTQLPKNLLFGHKQEEFSLQGKVIFKGSRVFIPEKLREQILSDLHFGHFGIVKMKSLARSFIWWPNIDSDIENIVKNCSTCATTQKNPAKIDTHHWEWPSTPWQRIHVDYFGPIQGKIFFLVVDAHSKWPEVFIAPNTTTDFTIQCLGSLFARYGFPISLVSDNGPQFVSEKFKLFLRKHGVKHMLSSPYHPATNGQAERYVQTIKKGLKNLSAESGTLQEKLNKFLMQYRKMPHITTGESPASLFLKRSIRTKIDLLLPNTKEYVENKQNAKKFKKPREFLVQQKVAVRNYTPEAKWKIGEVIEKLGKLHYKIKVGENIWKRHVDQITNVGSKVQYENKSYNNCNSSNFVPSFTGPDATDFPEATPPEQVPDQLPLSVPERSTKEPEPPEDTSSAYVTLDSDEKERNGVKQVPAVKLYSPKSIRKSSRIRKPPDRLSY